MRRNKRRKTKNHPTATPLGYDGRIRFGALNVQGFVDSLKLKNVLQLMGESGDAPMRAGSTCARQKRP